MEPTPEARAAELREIIDRCRGVIEIPQLGTKHSLNISVAAGVLLWDFYAKSAREAK